MASFPRTFGLETTPQTLAKLLAGRQKIQLIDVRSSGEFAGRRIESAVLIPLDKLDSRHVELDRDALVVCACQSGRRSASAQKILQRHGFRQASTLTGGVAQWARVGFPVVEEKNAPWAMERQVRIAAGTLVVAGVGFWILCSSRVLWAFGICRRRFGLCRDHRLVRYGPTTRQSAVEPPLMGARSLLTRIGFSSTEL